MRPLPLEVRTRGLAASKFYGYDGVIKQMGFRFPLQERGGCAVVENFHAGAPAREIFRRSQAEADQHETWAGFG